MTSFVGLTPNIILGPDSEGLSSYHQAEPDLKQMTHGTPSQLISTYRSMVWAIQLANLQTIQEIMRGKILDYSRGTRLFEI